MENQKKQKLRKASLVGISLLSLGLIYVFQRLDYWNAMVRLLGATPEINATASFIFNKSLRLVVNDALCFLLVYALFQEKKYLRVAFMVFCLEFFLVLPIYLIVKLTVEGTSEISSPLLSQIHRMIVNPMLMMILIIAFYYQRYWQTRNT